LDRSIRLLLAYKAGGDELSKFPAYGLLSELCSLCNTSKRKELISVKDKEAECLEAGWGAEKLSERLHFPLV
jgi:hypothetical protein